jgi:hypothetical protein
MKDNGFLHPLEDKGYICLAVVLELQNLKEWKDR